MEIVWMTIAYKITYRLIAIRWERLNDYMYYSIQICAYHFFNSLSFVTACTVGRFFQNVRHNIMHNIFL